MDKDLEKYIPTRPKAKARIITSVKLDREIYDRAYTLKGHISMTKLIEGLLKRFVEENTKA